MGFGIRSKNPGDVLPPTIPGGVSAVLTAPGQVVVTWGASTDDSGVLEYRVARSGSAVEVVVSSSAPRTHTYSNLPAGSYVFAVKAVDMHGNISNPEASSTITIAAGGSEPYWSDTNPDTFTVFENQTFSYTFTVTDIDSAIDLVYTATPGITVVEQAQVGTTRSLVVSGPAAIGTYEVDVDVAEAPAYISSLLPFEVKALSTVANGKPTWLEAVDPIYDNTFLWGGSNSATHSVMRLVTESGGFARPKHRKFYAFGGGHQDGYYNGILEYDLNGDTQPTGWSVLANTESPLDQVPYVDGVINTTGKAFVQYYDGLPGSTHSYETMCYDEATNRMARFGGSTWSIGFASSGYFVYDFNDSTWTKVAPHPQVTSPLVHGRTINDKATSKVLWSNGNQGAFFHMTDMTWGKTINTSAIAVASTTRMTSSYDTKRGRMIIMAKNSLCHFLVDFNAETISGQALFTATGDTEILAAEGIGQFYDEKLDRFWLFAGGKPTDPTSLLINKMYWIDAADFDDNAVVVNSTPLSMTIPFKQASYGNFMGIYKRFAFIPEWRVIALATTYNYPVHLIRLPS